MITASQRMQIKNMVDESTLGEYINGDDVLPTGKQFCDLRNAVEPLISGGHSNDLILAPIAPTGTIEVILIIDNCFLTDI